MSAELQVSVPAELIDAVAEAVAIRLQASASAPTNGNLRLLSLAEVAEALGRSERTVRKWVATGELPRVHLGAGSSFRFLEADLRAFCERRRVGDAEAAR
jgi:excisionase family DNA binding protein